MLESRRIGTDWGNKKKWIQFENVFISKQEKPCFSSEGIDVLLLLIVITKIVSVSASTTLRIIGNDFNKSVILFVFQEAENNTMSLTEFSYFKTVYYVSIKK